MAGTVRLNRRIRIRTALRRATMGTPGSVRIYRRERELYRTCAAAAEPDKIYRFLPADFPQSPLQVRDWGVRIQREMSVTAPSEQEAGLRESAERVVNDFAIQIATVNGSGSQTANLVLLRSIFQMGVPVSGKNMFPSNIAGLPTWYTVRASSKGYIARKKEVDFLVAMNAETAKEDVMTLSPGAAVVYDEPLKLNALRSDLIFYPVPFDKLVAPVCADAKLRRLVRNMIHDGLLGQLLGIGAALMD